MIRGALAAFALSLGFIAPAQAEVVDQGPAGFTVRHEVAVAAPAPEAFQAFLALPSWWDPSHSYTGDAAALSFAPVVGGCWCEALPNGGGVEHMRVGYLAPDEGAVRLLGGLGPLQGLGATGAMTVTVRPAENGPGSVARLTYVVIGYSPEGLDRMSGPVDVVLGQAMARYVAFAAGAEQGE